MKLIQVRRVTGGARRGREIERLRASGKKITAKITGMNTKRHFELDMSISSMLGGTSGIDFPTRVAFVVTTDEGMTYESDLANVPELIATRYIEQSLTVDVYVDERDSYVDIEGLPAYDPAELFPTLGGLIK